MFRISLALLLCSTTVADTVIDVKQTFGKVSQETIGLAITQARAKLSKGGNVTVFFQAGTYDISTTTIPFEVSHIAPAADAWLLFQGAGLEKTILRFDGRNDVIWGRDVQRLAFADLTFARQKLTTSQGLVVAADEDSVTMDVQPGYPGIAEIMGEPSRLKPGGGRWLRRYRHGADGTCQLIVDGSKGTKWPPTANSQVQWLNASAVQGHAGRWRLTGLSWRSNGHVEPHYSAGDVVAVKSKHDGQAFFLETGDGVAFRSVRWTEHSRGVIRGISNIQFDGCRVEKSPLAPKTGLASCLATPGGGPQLGQPNDPEIHNVSVRNHHSDGTGDDAVALFNVVGGDVSGARIRDSFARGILLSGCGRIALHDNALQRCPLWKTTLSASPSQLLV